MTAEETQLIANLTAAINRFVDVTEPRAQIIVEGDENAEVTLDDGRTIPSYTKSMKDLENLYSTSEILAGLIELQNFPIVREVDDGEGGKMLTWENSVSGDVKRIFPS